MQAENFLQAINQAKSYPSKLGNAVSSSFRQANQRATENAQRSRDLGISRADMAGGQTGAMLTTTQSVLPELTRRALERFPNPVTKAVAGVTRFLGPSQEDQQSADRILNKSFNPKDVALMRERGMAGVMGAVSPLDAVGPLKMPAPIKKVFSVQDDVLKVLESSRVGFRLSPTQIDDESIKKLPELYKTVVGEKPPKNASLTDMSKTIEDAYNSALRVQGEMVDEYTRTPIQRSLSDAVKSGAGNKPVYFGKLSKDKFNEINRRLAKSGKDPLKTKDLYIYPNVIEKLKQKRVLEGGMTPDEVADLAYSAIHNSKSRVLDTNVPHIKTIIRPTNESTANSAFVAGFGDSTSVKSVYPKDLSRIKNKSRGGR